MNRGARPAAFGILALILAVLPVTAADDARQIVEESERRAEAKSQRYEGVLEVIDANGRTSDKRWTLERFGSRGNSPRRR